MSDLAIQVEGLAKQFRIGARSEEYKTLRDVLANAAGRAARAVRSGFRVKREADELIWALNGVSFEVHRGEVLGIIGRNGAGKSTLLKILSRITEPTRGVAEIRGRVGSLLEVGTGFHAELTGKENIYLNGAILGMKRAEIDRKLEQIIEFSEVRRFIDTPVKHYSSGMQMRLAFAVAAHLEPEILLIDEVLAVGDASFQKKCLGKMGEVAKAGRTILFVSHNLAAVQSLCDRVIWLDDGKIVEQGEPSRAVSRYLQTSFSSVTEQVWPDCATAPGNEKVRLRRACIRPLDGFPSDVITIRTPFVMEFEYWNLEPGAHLNLSLHVYNEQGIMVFNAVPFGEPMWQGRAFPAGLFRDICHIPADLLNDGMYRIELLVVKDHTVVIHRQEDILVFDVQDSIEMRGAWYGKWSGAVRPVFEWRTELIEPDESHVKTTGASELKS